jgi:hypothetical protein
MKYLLPLMIILVANHIQANLGETEAQIETRYGKSKEELTPVTPDLKLQEPTTFHYSKGDYNIEVTFLKGLSVSEKYARIDGKPFAEKEFNQFFDANNFGSKWNEVAELGSNRFSHWNLENGKASASYSLGGYFLIITVTGFPLRP